MYNNLHNYIYIYILISVGGLAVVILSGSIFATSFFKKRPEEIIPITIMCVVVVLYISGLFGNLIFGLYLVYLLSICLLVSSFIFVVRKKKFKEFLAGIFTPGMLIFLVWFVVLLYLNYGKLATANDEFSHWMDSVKVMTLLDDFVTNPNSNSEFRSYPPAMSLFQYFATKTYFLVSGGKVFCEWVVYYAYQIFALSLLLPFLRGFSLEKPLENISIALIAAIIPSIIYSEFYNTVLIDAFVGLLTACAFTMILIHRKKDIVYHMYIILLCFCLVLAKDAGMMFAIFVAMAFATDYIIDLRKKGERLTPTKLLLSVAPVCSTVFAKLSWKMEILNHSIVPNFSSPIDYLAYTGMFFLHSDNTYRQLVVDYFKNALFKTKFTLGFTFISISYFWMFVVLVAILLVLLVVYRKYEPQNSLSRFVVVSVLFICVLVYWYGLGSVYVYKFSEYEALRLASYDRYMGMAYEALIVTVAIMILVFIQEHFQYTKFTNTAITLLVIISIILAPVWPNCNLLIKDHVRADKLLRRGYDEFADKIHSVCDGDDKIFFVEQESTGYSYYLTRFTARPNIVAGGFSIGKPFYDGDIWTLTMSAEEFQKTLIEEEYDYLAIFGLNDYFIKEFGELFEDISEIEAEAIYRINRETKLLEKCTVY